MKLRPLLIVAAIAAVSTAALAAGALSDIIPLPLQPTVPADKRSCAQQTSSGLGYTILRASPAGARKPTDADVVLVNYIGYLRETGVTFDQASPAPMPVGGVIPGFSEGLKMMGLGSVYRFCLPSRLAYGAEGAGPIPADADIVFQVELLDAKSQAEVDALRRQPSGK